MHELKMLGAFAYVATGAALLVRIGRTNSRLQWDEPPTIFRRTAIVAAWPAIIALNWRAFFPRRSQCSLNRP
jgi:hypothetical protein